MLRDLIGQTFGYLFVAIVLSLLSYGMIAYVTMEAHMAAWSMAMRGLHIIMTWVFITAFVWWRNRGS